MDNLNPTMPDLFQQLGLPSEESDIRKFISEHRPLPPNTRLADASFWTEAQSRFLRDELAEDAEWAEVVDQLNLALSA